MNIEIETRQLLQETQQLIQQLPPEAFASPLPALNGQSIGKHIRHVLGFYECLCYWKSPAILDYSTRKRDTEVECQPQIALNKVAYILGLLNNISIASRVQVLPDVRALNPEPVESTIGRELMYLFDHTVHHLAMINLAVKASFPEITLPEHLGVAHSTRQQMPDTSQ